MKKNKIKYQFIASISIILILSNIFCAMSLASFKIEKADLYSKGDCGQLIKKDGSIVRTTYIVYNNNGREYPAYCLDKLKPGVGEVGNYSVNTEKLLSNVYVWRAIINGYPYKSIQELGCNSEQEAFVATKMAIYSILYNYTIDNFSGIDEAGNRVYNALNEILTKARNGNEVKVSSDLSITTEKESLTLDSINAKYVSQMYKITANGKIDNYEVCVENAPEGTIITDENNNIKSTFSKSEKFKILIPIEFLGQGGEMIVNVKAEVETKPVFYGTSNNTANQDYAITGFMYENGSGKVKLNYSKNGTKIKILKRDSQTKEVLKGAKFDLLDNEKNIIHTNLITDENGEIVLENILPGNYLIKETKAPYDYEIYEEYIRIEINFNEEFSVIVNNSKEEKPEITIEKQNIEVTQKNKEERNIIEVSKEINTTNTQIEKVNNETNIVKKLPKTGM